MKWLALAAILMSAQAAAQSSPAPVAFQGFVIGQTIAQARAVVIPPSSSGPRELRCTNDLDKPSMLNELPTDRALGVVRCWPTAMSGRFRLRSEIPVSAEIAATAALQFRDGRLMMIETSYSETHSIALLAALVQKYGRPQLDESETVQNNFGAKYLQRTVQWKIGSGGVRLVTPDINLRMMSVTYFDWDEAARMDRDIVAEQASGLKL